MFENNRVADSAFGAAMKVPVLHFTGARLLGLFQLGIRSC